MSFRVIGRIVKVAMEPVGGLIDESAGAAAWVVALATDNADDAGEWSKNARKTSKGIRETVGWIAGAGAVGAAGGGGDDEGSGNGE
ncbi:MAG: hypothetical protein WAN66_03950 [Limnoraphis robusta]|uniref:hypothetical protein n=1 Tax=Limnoraphis robusta TaxID=1118279 RepID=UPI002B21A18F|nr:hypothetical protein [Limnoraphis robusta]MEA5499028.1 hypothetical protein [Limnoraphis robusta BA-68 BA1]MEA5539369.1 hypothetical protein [Limnoraphis robusta Tam1]